jgi:hypothetical protein
VKGICGGLAAPAGGSIELEAPLALIMVASLRLGEGRSVRERLKAIAGSCDSWAWILASLILMVEGCAEKLEEAFKADLTPSPRAVKLLLKDLEVLECVGEARH